MTQTPSPLLTQVQNEKLVGNYSLKTFYIHNVGLSMLSLFLQMLQLNLESQMTHEGSQTPTATDVHQPALLEKNPAWVQTQYHGMVWIIPKSHTAEDTGLTTRFILHRPVVPHPPSVQAMAAEHHGAGRQGEQAGLLAGCVKRGRDCGVMSCPEAGGRRLRNHPLPKVSRLPYLLFCVHGSVHSPLCLYSFPLDMGV